MDFGAVLYESIDRVPTIKLNRPEGIMFKKRAEEVGFKQAVAERDPGEPIPGSKN